METKKVLSSLCYFSIFFAYILFPLAVFFATSDATTKQHAKKSLLSQLIPLIPMVFIVIAIIYDIAIFQSPRVFSAITIAISVLTLLVVAVWNIVKGIQILLAEK